MCLAAGCKLRYHGGVGRGTAVDRALGVGAHLPVHGVGVGVGVGEAVGVGVAVTVAVGVGVGPGGEPDCAQYLPPALKFVGPLAPPQTIISLPVHTAV